MNLSQFQIAFLLSALAGLSTTIGGFLFLSKRLCQKNYLSFFLGLSAGVMIYLSFVELLPEAIESLGFFQANLFFFLGLIIMAIIDFAIPHHYLEKKMCSRNEKIDPKMLSTGIVVTIGLIIHNLPEGMAVFMSSYSNIKLGVLLASAIAIHNIPEGVAVAVPIYFATLNKTKAVKYTFIAGIAEPVGALIAYFLLKPWLSQNFLAYIFSIVAGIMVYISFDELLPASFRDDDGHKALFGLVIGMIAVSTSLLFL